MIFSLEPERDHPLEGPSQAQKTFLHKNINFFCIINFDDKLDFSLITILMGNTCSTASFPIIISGFIKRY